MKNSVELPNDLMLELRLRAERERKNIKDKLVELLRAGLSVQAAAPVEMAHSPLVKDKVSGLPLIECRHAAAQDAEMSPERVAQILIEQEATFYVETR